MPTPRGLPKGPPVGGGGLVLLEQHTASSSATLDFTTFISSTYDEYQIDFINIIPATIGDDLYMRMGTGGGPTWDAGTNYTWTGWRWLAAGSGTSGGAGQSQIVLALGENPGGGIWGVCGSIKLVDPQSASMYKQIFGQFTEFDNAGGSLGGTTTSGGYVSTTAVTGVRFLTANAHNITSGTIRVYGIAKS